VTPRRQWTLLLAIVAAISVGFVGTAVGERRTEAAARETGWPSVSSYLREQLGRDHRYVSAMVARDGSTFYGGLNADETDEFEIASVTKVFTAELLRIQLDSGLISRSTTVGDVLGEKVQGSPISDVTVMELAGHTSGLPRIGDVGIRRWMAPFFNKNPYKDISNEAVIEMAKKPALEKRGEYEYSNLGFALLGQVLAENDGRGFPELMREELLLPLQMHDTFLMEIGTTTENSPRGGESDIWPAEPWEMEGFLPAAGLRSTSEDMDKFARHILEKGVPDFTWVFDEANQAYWHNGGSFGFSSLLALNLKDGTAVFLGSGEPESVVEEGMELLNMSLGLPDGEKVEKANGGGAV
jgi:CubicO group peptidase (beta-lactamase class C family)